MIPLYPALKRSVALWRSRTGTESPPESASEEIWGRRFFGRNQNRCTVCSKPQGPYYSQLRGLTELFDSGVLWRFCRNLESYRSLRFVEVFEAFSCYSVRVSSDRARRQALLYWRSCSSECRCVYSKTRKSGIEAQLDSRAQLLHLGLSASIL